MGCDVKLNTLNHFKKEGFISDMRVILDHSKFNEANKHYTGLAADLYGLNIEGKLLFDISKTKKSPVGPSDKIYTASVNYIAEPVDELFNELNKLVDTKNEIDKSTIEIIKNREPESKIVYIGNKYKNSNVFHFSESLSAASKINERARVSNKGFLLESKDERLLYDLINEFYTRTGKTFDINNKTEVGLESQKRFYKLMDNKGIKGLQISDLNGNLHLIKFSFPKEIVSSDTTLDLKTEPLVDEIDTDLYEEDPGMAKSTLDQKHWFLKSDLDKLYKKYTPSEINDMLLQDEEVAKETLIKALYPNEFINDRYIPNRDVNDQIKNCK